MKYMSDTKDNVINILTTGGLLAVFSALVKAILSSETIKNKVRGFFAGSILGTLVFFVLRNISLAPFYKEILCICFSSFATTIWPVVEAKFIKMVKKNNNVLPSNDD